MILFCQTTIDLKVIKYFLHKFSHYKSINPFFLFNILSHFLYFQQHDICCYLPDKTKLITFCDDDPRLRGRRSLPPHNYASARTRVTFLPHHSGCFVNIPRHRCPDSARCNEAREDRGQSAKMLSKGQTWTLRRGSNSLEGLIKHTKLLESRSAEFRESEFSTRPPRVRDVRRRSAR